MGLNSDVKKHWTTTHPDCFASCEDDARLASYDVIVVDMMYALYLYYNCESGMQLVQQFAQRLLVRLPAGRVVYLCFDHPTPCRAKALTQASRRRRLPSDPRSVSGSMSLDGVYQPYESALADFERRSVIVQFLSTELALFCLGLDLVVHVHAPDLHVSISKHRAAPFLEKSYGEADLSSCAFAVRESLLGRRVVLRGIDTDALLILVLQFHRYGATADFFFDYRDKQTLVDCSRLAPRISLNECFIVILCKTDYTQKLFKGVSARSVLQSIRDQPVTSVLCSAKGVSRAWRSLLARFHLIPDAGNEIVRAYWNFRLWYSLDVKALDYRLYGWDAQGGHASAVAQPFV